MKNRKIKSLTKKELLAILNKVWGLLLIITTRQKTKRSTINNATRHTPRKCN